VPFAHDTEASLLAAVALVNSAEEPDTLTTVEELDAFYVTHTYTGSRTRDRDELEAVRALRAPLRTLLTSSRDDAVGIVNRMLAEAGAVPQLVRHDGEDWHLHATDSTAPFATRIAVETAMAMVDVIRADEMSRLGVCADDECGGVVLDLSRNRSRRFCSTACGNRNAVAAYRARQSHQN
jgi:predicted RNA-binding Zn ribbon-like protein